MHLEGRAISEFVNKVQQYLAGRRVPARCFASWQGNHLLLIADFSCLSLLQELGDRLGYVVSGREYTTGTVSAWSVVRKGREDESTVDG